MLRSVLVALCVSAIAGAQARPAFSGEWVRVDSAPARPTTAATGDGAFRVGDMGSGWGSPLSIRQTGDTLIVKYVHFSTYDLQPKLRHTFSLNGDESVNRITIGHAESVQRSRVRWEGSSLVITTLHPTPPEVGKSPHRDSSGTVTRFGRQARRRDDAARRTRAECRPHYVRAGLAESLAENCY